VVVGALERDRAAVEHLLLQQTIDVEAGIIALLRVGANAIGLILARDGKSEDVGGPVVGAAGIVSRVGLRIPEIIGDAAGDERVVPLVRSAFDTVMTLEDAERIDQLLVEDLAPNGGTVVAAIDFRRILRNEAWIEP